MNIRNFLLLSVLVAVLSCKNEENKDVVTVPKVDQKQLFKVDFDLIVKKDDSLQLYYLEEGMNDYDGGKYELALVKGNEKEQHISFTLPQDVLPTQLRLDLGNNKQQAPIEFKKFEMKYLDKTFSVKDTLIFQYFQPNDQVDWDRKKGIAKPIVKEGVFYDPGIGGREIFKNELKNIIK